MPHVPHDNDDPLTAREEKIAQRAAELAIQQVYLQVGKSVITKIFWIAGLCVVGLFVFLSGKGSISPH